MRRPAPRPLQRALADAVPAAAPAGLLARVQAAWPEVAGPAIAPEAEPASERGGVVTVACRAGVWAQELELLGGDLRERLNARVAPDPGDPLVTRLRFVVRSP